jgi:hypothetical protein
MDFAQRGAMMVVGEQEVIKAMSVEPFNSIERFSSTTT